MKFRFCAVLTALVLTMLMMGSLVQYHHHAADGSVCLCMSVECHSQSADDDSHGDCGHEHSGEGENMACTLHIDEFCNKDNSRPTDLMPDLWLLCVFLPTTDLLSASEKSRANYHIAGTPKLRRCDSGAAVLRAPPVDDIFAV